MDMNDKYIDKDEFNKRINDLEAKLDVIVNKLESLTLVINKSNNITDSLMNLPSTNLVSNTIKEAIVLYSIDRRIDNVVNRLKLSKDKVVIRTCRSNTISTNMLVKRLNTHNKQFKLNPGDKPLSKPFIHRQYNVSNPHDVSLFIVNKLAVSEEINIKVYYGHLIVDTVDVNKLLSMYDSIITNFKPNVISTLVNEYHIDQPDTKVKDEPNQKVIHFDYDVEIKREFETEVDNDVEDNKAKMKSKASISN